MRVPVVAVFRGRRFYGTAAFRNKDSVEVNRMVNSSISNAALNATWFAAKLENCAFPAQIGSRSKKFLLLYRGVKWQQTKKQS
jgi:hypothetical protein